ncbi:MAG: hypothetical protein ACI3Y5_04915, partial [Prevotella sp.]
RSLPFQGAPLSMLLARTIFLAICSLPFQGAPLSMLLARTIRLAMRSLPFQGALLSMLLALVFYGRFDWSGVDMIFLCSMKELKLIAQGTALGQQHWARS